MVTRVAGAEYAGEKMQIARRDREMKLAISVSGDELLFFFFLDLNLTLLVDASDDATGQRSPPYITVMKQHYM